MRIWYCQIYFINRNALLYHVTVKRLLSCFNCISYGNGKVNCQTKYNTQAKKILMDCLLIELLTGLVKSAYLHYGIANKVSVTIQSEVSTKK